jgi:hypothetical protein
MRTTATLLLVAVGGGFVAGCDQALTIPDRFPAPLVETLPLRVAVYYPAESFSEFTYIEAAGGETDWTIRAGDANVAMFDAVSRRLFREAVRIDQLPAAGAAAGYDAYLEPRVDAFEFALPSQSGTNQYSVWIRYKLKVYGRDGTLIQEWPVSAYGQSASSTLQPARSMQEATVLAMRDAEATFSTGFARQKAIRQQLLDQTTSDQTPSDQTPAEEANTDGTP